MFYFFNFNAYVRFFVKILIEMNVNMSSELNFSDVYRSVNYIGSVAKFTGTPSRFIHFACSRYFIDNT